MGFHKNLTQKDLHSPSRFKVKNETGTDILAFRAVAIEEINGGLLSIILPKVGGHTGLYGITETAIGDTEEGFITTFGILEGVTGILGDPDQFGSVGIYVDILDDPNPSAEAGDIVKSVFDPVTNDPITAQVAIPLSPISGGEGILFVTGGVPGGVASSISGGGPASIEEFKGFWNPGDAGELFPTDSIVNTDDVKIGDYFIVNEVTPGRPINPTGMADIFDDLIVGDVIFSMVDDPGPFDFSTFYINRTITGLEREILQDLKPARLGSDGDVLVVSGTPGTEYDLRRLDADEVTVSDSVHFPIDNTVEDALVDLTSRIRSISTNDFQGDWDTTGEPSATEYRAGYFWRIVVDPPVTINVGPLPGEDILVKTNDLIYYDGLTVNSVTDLQDFFVLAEEQVPTDVIDDVTFYEDTRVSTPDPAGIGPDSIDAQVGVTTETIRGVFTNVPIVKEDRLTTITIDPSTNVGILSTSAAQVPVGRNSNENVEDAGGSEIITSTQTIRQGLGILVNKIDDLVANDIEPFSDITGNRGIGNIIIDEGGTELGFRHPTTADLEVSGINSDSLDGLAGTAPTENTDLIERILQGRVEFRGEFDPSGGVIPSDITNEDYIIKGWFWISTGEGTFGSPDGITASIGQLVFAEPASGEVRKDDASTVTGLDFFIAGGSGTGGSADHPFQNIYIDDTLAPQDATGATRGDYWIVGADGAGEFFDPIGDQYGDTLRTSDLLFKLANTGAPIAAITDITVVRSSGNFVDLIDTSVVFPASDPMADSFNRVNTDTPTDEDIVVPVVSNTGDGLVFSPLITFNSIPDGTMAETYQTVNFRYNTTDINNPDDSTFELTNIPYDDSVYRTRNNFSSTPRVITRGTVTAITEINGFTIDGTGIRLDVPGTVDSFDADILSIESFDLVVENDAIIVAHVDDNDPNTDPKLKSYTTATLNNDPITDPTMFLDVGEWSYERLTDTSIQITVHEPITREVLTPLGTSTPSSDVRLSNLVLNVEVDGAADTITIQSNSVAFTNPQFTSITATVLNINSINSFLDSFANIRVRFNTYSQPSTFGPLTTSAPGTSIATDLTDSLESGQSPSTLTLLTRSLDVTLASDDAITIATRSSTPTFTAVATFNYTNILTIPQSLTATLSRTGQPSEVAFGHNVWQGDIPLGNSIPAQDLIDHFTADILRSGIPSGDYTFSDFPNTPIITSIGQLNNQPLVFAQLPAARNRVLIINSDLVGTSTITYPILNSPAPITTPGNILGSFTLTGGDGTVVPYSVYRVNASEAALPSSPINPETLTVT